MFKNKKIKWLIIVSLIVATILGAVYGIYKYKEKKVLDGYDQYINILKNECNADIMYYGDDPGFRERLGAHEIDSISHEILFAKEDAGYRAIVLWDRNGTLKISDEDLLTIKEEVEKNGLDMFYIGTGYLGKLVELGFSVGIRQGEESLEYIGSIFKGREVQQNEYGNLYAQHGLWDESYEDNLVYNPESIHFHIVSMMYDYATGVASW